MPLRPSTSRDITNNAKAWAEGESFKANAKGWGYNPGRAALPGRDDLGALAAASTVSPAKALEALEDAHAWLRPDGGGGVPEELLADCAPAFDLQPDVPFPERKDTKDPYTRG